MTLAKYIGDLLYRYECVIVPNFGGFVTNEISAKVNHLTHTFYAPSKQLTFNSHLQNSDGLLVNYVASVKNISYSKASVFIENEVNLWKTSLINETVELESIGSFYLSKDGKYIFEPSNTVNYLTSSFGLNTYVSQAVKREEYKEKDFTGKEYCKKKGIEIYYNKREHRFSSSSLRKQVINSEKSK